MTTKTTKTLKTKLRLKCGGNTGVPRKELASDWCNSVGRAGMKDMVAGMFLTRKTIERVMECDENYRPQDDTIDRVLNYFGLQGEYKQVKMQSKYRNKPKKEKKES